MIKQILMFFQGKKPEKAREYTGVADFLLNAPFEEQKKAITRAAQKANEDQMKVFKAAQLKAKAN